MARRTYTLEEMVANWPLWFAVLALSVVGTAEALVEAYSSEIASPAFQHRSKSWNPRRWTKLYRAHRRIWRSVGEVFQIEEADGWLSAAARLERLTAEQIQQEIFCQWEEIQQLAVESASEMREVVRMLIEDIRTPGGNEGDIDQNELESIEIQFFLRVTMPCWLRHKTTPTRLMRAARCGNIDAICDLLALDKSTVADPFIAREIQSAALERRPARLNRIATALRLRESKATQRKQLKRSLAGMLKAFAEKLQLRLTEPEVRQLFDGVARARGRSIDVDLPDSSEAFAKAIQRERKAWQIGPKGRTKIGR